MCPGFTGDSVHLAAADDMSAGEFYNQEKGPPANLFKSCFGHFMHTLVQKCMISSSLSGKNEINCTICGIAIPAALIILWHERH